MKKTIFALAALAALAMGCAKEQQPSDTPAEVQKTYLNAYVEDTKVSVDGKGVCSWQEGDVLAVWFVTDQETVTDENGKETVNEISGVRLEFTYESDNADGSAKFATTADVPEEFYSARAAFPASSVSSTGGFSLERNYTYDADSVPVYLRDYYVIRNEDGSLSSNLVHNASIMKFTLRDIPAYAAGFVLEFTGNVNIKTEFPYKTGYDEDIVLHSVAAQGRTPIRFYLIDGDQDIIEGTVKTFKEGTKPVDTDSYIDMGLVDFQKENLRKDYVKICGVKWAKGNLYYKSGNSVSGFQSGWGLKANQWDYAGYNLNENTVANVKYTYSSEKATEMRVNRTSAEFEHFNWGGIGKWSYDYTNYIKPASAPFDFSGKLYSDENGTTELIGDARFGAEGEDTPAIYGDLAFWATKGKYKTPTNAEMKSIHNEGSKIYGWYEVDGFKVYGWLIRTPDLGYTRQEDAVANQNRTFTDADLETGIFLVCGGRVANSYSDRVIGQRTEGEYRNAAFIKKVANGEEIFTGKTGTRDMYYSLYYGMPSTTVAKMYTEITATARPDNKANDAFDAAAGFMIRPVLVD